MGGQGTEAKEQRRSPQALVGLMTQTSSWCSSVITSPFVRYVLLKERNMLMTVKHEARRTGFIMPAPERTWKVYSRYIHLKYAIFYQLIECCKGSWVRIPPRAAWKISCPGCKIRVHSWLVCFAFAFLYTLFVGKKIYGENQIGFGREGELQTYPPVYYEVNSVWVCFRRER